MTDEKVKKTEENQPKADRPRAEIDIEATPVSSDTHIVLGTTNNPKAHWYVIHTYSGHEKKVAQALIQRLETMNLKENVMELLIPTQNKIKIVKGQKQKVAEKIFPGYMLAKMIMTDDTWLAVRTTQGVTGFVGAGNKPTPLPPKEVETIIKFTQLEAPKYKASFTQGEAVKIIDGPFTEFLGSVESIDIEKGKVKVLVSIFGRETPVELDFLQVSKI